MGASYVEKFSNHAGTTLASAITTTDGTSMSIASATGFPASPQYRIRIDNEIMLVTARSGTSLTVTRGVDGSSAATHANGASVSLVLTSTGLTNLIYEATPDICELRLTGTSGSPVDTSSSSATKTTIYLTPYTGSRIRLYDGSEWKVYQTAEVSLAITGGSLTADKNYDVFAYYDSATDSVKLETLIWTDDTTRATALADQDGVWVKTGATTRRYVGTMRSVDTNGYADYMAKRLLWNFKNRVPRPVYIGYATASWTYNSTTIRQANAASTLKIDVVAGLQHALLSLDLYVMALAGGTGYPVCGIGVNATNAFTNDTHSRNHTSTLNALTAHLKEHPRVGYSAYNWCEKCSTANTHTFYGTSGDKYSSLRGWWEC